MSDLHDTQEELPWAVVCRSGPARLDELGG